MKTVVDNAYLLTEEAIEAYLADVREAGVAASAIAKYRTPLKDLFTWLGNDKIVTAERLVAWRGEIESRGYAPKTIWNYIGQINTFFRSYGYETLCIPKPLRKDLTGKTFGYLTAITPVGKNERNNVIWKCQCRCGKEVDVAATQLIAMNTTSCGCLKTDIIRYINRYEGGTELRKVLSDDAISHRTASGYTGVYLVRGKWVARMIYKGISYSLGSYFKIEDAVKARALAKERVMEDAQGLYEATAHLYGSMPARPIKRNEKTQESFDPIVRPARRSDNTSGYTGVSWNDGKWRASIGYGGTRYILGYFSDLDEAVTIRKLAEQFAADGEIEKLERIARGCYACESLGSH